MISPNGPASQNGMRQPTVTTKSDEAPHTANMAVANKDPTSKPPAVDAGTMEQ